MWESEKLFEKAVMQKIEAESGACFRLETAATAPGIPDLYVLANGIDYFIEFKNMYNVPVTSKRFKVAWRAGQQRFALQYREKMRFLKPRYHDEHDDTYTDGFEYKFSWTFAGLKDGVLLIPMYQVFDNSIVHSDDAVFIFTLDEFRKLNILEFLRAHSQVFIPDRAHYDPLRYTIAVQNYWLSRMFFKNSAFLFDYAAASDLIAENPSLFNCSDFSFETALKQYQFVVNSMLEQYHVFLKNN